ncbi:MAG: CDP-alcohol phosphatidyltransferase family protein [Myxococcota bacterium]
MKLTANTITATRMILVPFPCVWLAQEDLTYKWIAFFLLIALGMTDFIDGWLARHQGPTKLGALLDPVADKIFTAAVALSFAAMHAFHGAVVAAILGREFFLTGFRSSLLQRGQRMQVHPFAKLKTIFQMGGFGTIFLTLFSPDPWHTNIPAIVGLLFAAVWTHCKIHKQTPPTWLLPVAGAFAYVAIANTVLTPNTSAHTQAAVIVFMTWASAVIYVYRGWKIVWSHLRTSDAVRFVWAMTYPICVAMWVTVSSHLLLPLIFWLGIELVHGGIDNVASTYNRHVAATTLGFSSLLALAFCMFALGAASLSATQWMLPVAWIMWTASILLCAKAAWQNRQIFMAPTPDAS